MGLGWCKARNNGPRSKHSVGPFHGWDQAMPDFGERDMRGQQHKHFKRIASSFRSSWGRPQLMVHRVACACYLLDTMLLFHGRFRKRTVTDRGPRPMQLLPHSSAQAAPPGRAPAERTSINITPALPTARLAVVPQGTTPKLGKTSIRPRQKAKGSSRAASSAIGRCPPWSWRAPSVKRCALGECASAAYFSLALELPAIVVGVLVRDDCVRFLKSKRPRPRARALRLYTSRSTRVEATVGAVVWSARKGDRWHGI